MNLTKKLQKLDKFRGEIGSQSILFENYLGKNWDQTNESLVDAVYKVLRDTVKAYEILTTWIETEHPNWMEELEDVKENTEEEK